MILQASDASRGLQIFVRIMPSAGFLAIVVVATAVGATAGFALGSLWALNDRTVSHISTEKMPPGATQPTAYMPAGEPLSVNRFNGTLELSTVLPTGNVVMGPTSENHFVFGTGPQGNYAVMEVTWESSDVAELGAVLFRLHGDFGYVGEASSLDWEYLADVIGPSPLYLAAPVDPDARYVWAVYPYHDQMIVNLRFESAASIFEEEPPEDYRVFNQAGGFLPGPAVASGAAAIVAGTSAVLGRFVWVFYWRLNPEAVVGNPNRRRLLELARTRPGLSLRETARETGFSKTATRYHLNVLAQFGFVLLVKEQPEARTVRVFASRGSSQFSNTPQARALAIALSREPCRALAKLFLNRSDVEDPVREGTSLASISLAEAARDTGLPKPTALRHLRALAKAGVLEIEGASPRDRRYALTPSGSRNLQEMAVLISQAPHASNANEAAASDFTFA